MGGILDELRESRKQAINYEGQIISEMYKQVIKLVRLKNKYGQVNCQYSVPEMMYGFPVYDLVKITNKLNKKMKQDGFKTTVNDACIFISWT